jgi:purine-binding chemotaxis protein CheW
MSTQLATFWLADDLYGIPVERVQEVLREQVMTKVPLSPSTVSGLINLRGQVVTSVDLRRRLDLRVVPGQPTMLVVAFVEGESIALVVDRIGGVVDVNDEQFETPPDTLTESRRSLVRGAYKLDGQLLLGLDVDAAVAA